MFKACLIGLLLLSSYFATAATYHVKPTGNDGNTGLDWANAYATVQKALSSASSGDEIWVAAGTYYPTAGTDRAISFIMKPGVAIYGGFPATGNPTMTARDWNAHLTTLSGDIGTSGDNADNSYHVIFNEFNSLDATAILDGFTITGGNANGSNPHDSGGGMYNFYSSPTIENTAFNENSADYGGGMYNYESSPSVANSNFSDNTANFDGGGMNNAAFSSPMIEDTGFSGNTAEDGGGMFNDNESSPTVSNSTFSNNYASSGGGMYNVALSSPAVSNSTFNENTADYGGGMYNLLFSYPTIENTTFSDNSAFTDGGGMYNDNSSFPTVSNSTFSENSATASGGGMYNSSSSPTVSNITFSDNTANSGGGMYNNNYSSPTVSNTTFSKNTADYGGGMLNDYFSSPTVSNTTFSENSATDSGGGMFNNSSSSPTVSNTAFNENTAGEGGGMYNYSSSPAVEITTFSDNTANEGGGMYNYYYSFPTVSNTTFSKNTADNGGGMYNLRNSSPTIENTTFSENSATDSGGGMYNSSSSSPTVSNTAFNENTAGEGGGMYNYSSFPTVEITTFSDNTANEGGGMYNSSSSPTVDNTEFSENSADYGGGMYNDDSSPTITNATFSLNSVMFTGGGISNDKSSSPTIDNTGFSENTADLGGGMANIDNSSPTITNATFSLNTTTSLGGGMYNESSSPTMDNIEFSENTASSGGGMYNDAYASPTMDNIKFSKNTAAYNGGGMYNFSFSSPTITNSTFSLNIADGGGGMYNFSSSPTITNSIFWNDDNSDEITNSASSLVITYSIVRDGYAGTGNKDEDPRFIDAENGDLHLLACSPAVDAGTDTGAPTTDFDGNARYDAIPGGAVTDMGAFEFQAGGSDEGCNEPPVAACKNMTVNADANCQGMAVATDFNNGSSDPDGDDLTFTVSPEGPYALGDTDVILTVSDGQASSTCPATITVEDNTAPTANCPNNITVSNDPGECDAVVNFLVTATDNCPGVGISTSIASGSIFAVGTQTVVATATDAAGNSAPCSFDVTVKDYENPSIFCPGDFSVTADMAGCTAEVAIPTPTTSDNCGIMGSRYRYREVDENGVDIPGEDWSGYTSAASQVFALGYWKIEWMTRDLSGNENECYFIITIEANDAPTFIGTIDEVELYTDDGASCPLDAFDECLAFFAPLVGTEFTPGESFTIAGTSQNYPGTSLFADDVTTVGDLSLVLNSLIKFSNGCEATIALRWKLVDDCGTESVSFITQTFKIYDNTKPVLNCSGLNLTVPAEEDLCGATVVVPAPTATDNCQEEIELEARYRLVDENNNNLGPWSSWTADPSGYFEVGRYKIRWRAKDGCGNTKGCTRYLTVEDTQQPDIECFDQDIVFNGEESIDLVLEDLSEASDNCEIAEHFLDINEISCEALGSSITVTSTVEDVNGLENSCTSTVTVLGLPCGWSQEPDGIGCEDGSAVSYDVPEETFTVSSMDCFNGITSGSDEYAFAQYNLCGNGTITAEVRSITGNTNGWAGVIMRENNDPQAKSVAFMSNLASNHRRAVRNTTGGNVTSQLMPAFNRHWVRINRVGNSFRMYASSNGSSWFLRSSQTVAMNSCIEVGLVVTGYSGNSDITATFENVSVTGNTFFELIGNPGNDFEQVVPVNKNQLTVYPNPSTGIFNVAWDNPTGMEGQFQIFNAHGEVVETAQVYDSKTNFDLSHLPAGMYFVQLSTADGLVTTQRVVLARP